MADERTYISQIRLPGDSTNYYLKDAVARDLIAQLQGVTFHKCEVLEEGDEGFDTYGAGGDTPYGVQWSFTVGGDTTTVTGALPASAANHSYIYLVPSRYSRSGVLDTFDEYIPVQTGTVTDPETHQSVAQWSWEKIGDTEIDFDALKALAYANTATGSTSLSTVDSAAFANGAVSASATYTPAGSVSVTLSQTSTAATLTKSDYTPAGSVSVSLDYTTSDATLTKADYTPAGSVSVTLDQTSTAATLTKSDYTPAGSVSKPDVTVTTSDASIYVLDQAGSVTAGSAASFTSGTFDGGSFTQGTDQFTAPTWSASVSPSNPEVLVFSWTAGSFSQGEDSFTAATHGADTWSADTPTSVTLPTFKQVSVVQDVSAELASTPTFTGTKATNALVTGVSYDKASVSSSTFSGTKATGALVTGVAYDKASVSSSTFSGTKAENALVTGVSYDKAGVSSAGFEGTQATISSTGTATGDVNLTSSTKTITITVTPDA